MAVVVSTVNVNVIMDIVIDSRSFSHIRCDVAIIGIIESVVWIFYSFRVLFWSRRSVGSHAEIVVSVIVFIVIDGVDVVQRVSL